MCPLHPGRNTQPLELVRSSRKGLGQARLQVAGLEDLQGLRVEERPEVLTVLVVAGIGFSEEPIIEAHFRFHGMIRRNPVQGRFDLPPIGSATTASRRVIGATKLNHFTRRGVLDDADAFDEKGIAQSHFPPRSER